MIKRYSNQAALLVTGMLAVTTVTFAANPLWTYSPPSPSSVSVAEGVSATVTYTVTSQTNKPKSLVLQTSPATAGITASACNLPGKGSTCTLTITIDGSRVPSGGIHGGPYLCQADSNGAPNPNQCYQPSPANLLTIIKKSTSLGVSVSKLALSVTGYTEYGLGTPPPDSGVSRSITVRNTGSITATNFSITYPTWPSTTSTTTDCTSTLAAGEPCTITIHPGGTATSDGVNPCTTGVAPTPQTITFSADNVLSVSTSVVILGYGCIYQSGYVYALDDTQGCSGLNCTGSVGGKVVTTSDQIAAYPDGIVWSSRGTTGGGSNGFDSADVTYDIIPLIGSIPSVSSTYDAAKSEYDSTYGAGTSQCPFPHRDSFASCNGALDGACNSNNILALYGIYTTDSQTATVSFVATPTNSYAAGLCKGPIGSPSYSDWYLPAICEMGFATPGYGVDVGCGTSSNPTLQNIQTSLINLSNFTLPAGFYWSSTESSTNPQNLVLFQNFRNINSYQEYQTKNAQNGVRCSRALTP